MTLWWWMDEVTFKFKSFSILAIRCRLQNTPANCCTETTPTDASTGRRGELGWVCYSSTLIDHFLRHSGRWYNENKCRESARARSKAFGVGRQSWRAAARRFAVWTASRKAQKKVLVTKFEGKVSLSDGDCLIFNLECVSLADDDHNGSNWTDHSCIHWM